MNKMMKKIEDYVLSEESLDIQFSILISTIIIGFINDVLFNNSTIGAIIMSIMLCIIILEVILSAVVISNINRKKYKDGDK